MPTNRIRVVFNERGIKCKVWDKDGQKYDVSDIFEKVGGQVIEGGISTDLTLRHGTNSLETCLRFKALKKDLKFDVEEGVISQILEMGASSDSTPDDE